jgi:hypothetical protein
MCKLAGNDFIPPARNAVQMLASVYIDTERIIRGSEFAIYRTTQQHAGKVKGC